MGTSDDHMLGQNISEETQEKISFIETICRNKGSKSLSRLLPSAKSGSKKRKKSCQIRRRILHHMLNVIVKRFGITSPVKRS